MQIETQHCEKSHVVNAKHARKYRLPARRAGWRASRLSLAENAGMTQRARVFPHVGVSLLLARMRRDEASRQRIEAVFAASWFSDPLAAFR